METRTINLPAATVEHAHQLAEELRARELDGITVQGVTVSVPWASDIVTFALFFGDLAAAHCPADELTRAVVGTTTTGKSNLMPQILEQKGN